MRNRFDEVQAPSGDSCASYLNLSIGSTTRFYLLRKEKGMSEDIKECVLCGDEIDVQANGWAHGHNAQPLADGQCCSSCNGLVIIARIRQMREYAEESVS